MSVAAERPVVPDFLQQPKPPRLLGLVWTLLVIDTLGTQHPYTVIPLPRSVLQLVTMGAVFAAFPLALLLNPRVRLRPSAYLMLLTFLAVASTVSSLRLESGYGALFRCARFAVFVLTLWLLTPWWHDWVTFVRIHIKALTGVLFTVAVGLLVAPGTALNETYGGRLLGAVWPLTPPQVGQYAATVVGLTILLWLGRHTSRTSVFVVAGPALALLLLSHTRTALIGLAGGLAVALLSLATSSARARKVFTWTIIVGGLGAVLAGAAIQTWFRRGQSDLTELTGREKVWNALLAWPRTLSEQIFGVGLSNKSFGGLPIDSSWLAVYHEQGYLGLTLVVGYLLTLLCVAVLRPGSLTRAATLFLVVYSVIASYTEAGLGDASPYLLNLTIAAVLVANVKPGASR
ncbi:O-antigen ligase domain-containing protein [Actinophytocola sp.]|uniref:O-antigen ligase domain-containing protein n=1 Tax=Actinophytocola sp. TaxID=1872138 RepID=UPI0038999D7D